MQAALPQSRIDRSSVVPFYFQLKKALAEEIVSGRWSPGDRLPAEPTICDHFQVSRSTVRQALAELEVEGTIRREKGRGTFVAEPSSTAWLLQSAHGFFEEAARAGHTVTSRVLRREVGPLPTWACDALGLPGGGEGLTVERLRWVGDRLVTYVVTHLLVEFADAVMAADLETGSLYRTLEEAHGVVVHGGRRIVEAVQAQDKLAPLLEVEPGAPLLLVESVSWEPDLRPFECYRAWHRADQTRVEVHVVSQAVASKAGFEPRGLRVIGEP
ncbi:MAG: GntR family transcriptional regulator [Acidimicrobiales bacterium]